MRRVRLIAGLLALALVFPAAAPFRAQTPGGGVRTPEYRIALPGYAYAFPRDHGAHRDYQIEWWYFTGHLDGAGDERFGYELTFFRIGMDQIADNPSAWTVDELHIAHFALSDLDRRTFFFDEQVSRGGPGIAHAAEGTLDVRNRNWTARLESGAGDAGGAMALRARSGGVELDLRLTSAKPPVVHGAGGVSRKGNAPGQASHYYSMTRLETEGRVGIDGRSIPVAGQSWMDHEFGTNQLGADQVGWDWFSLQLDNGEEIMLYQLRRTNGAADPNSSGTVVAPDGSSVYLPLAAFRVRSLREWASPESEAVYRLDWEIAIPAFGGSLRVTPLMDAQELVTTRSTGIAYWEGAVAVEGVWRGQPVTGRGYVELTGYSEGDRPDV